MRSFRRRQLGLTLIEVLAAMTVAAAMTAGVVRLIDTYTNDTKLAVTAQHISAIGSAAQAYIKDNYSAVQGVATAATPALITVPMLTATGYLNAGFSTTNNQNQATCVLVLEPSANMLNALVVTEGGNTINDIDLGGIAGLVGANGGGVYSTAATTLRGTMGGWSVATGNFAAANASGQTCNGSAGTPTIAAGHPIMALWFADGDVSSGFVHRDAVAGHPELNTMNTPLIMNSTQTVNNACTSAGAIARDASGSIMSCSSGTWKYPGDGKCVATALDLNLLHDDGRCYNSSGNANSPAGADWFFLEVYRHTNQTNYYTAQRVVGMTGAAAGKVWLRNQQSGSAGVGWSAWKQIADPSIQMQSSRILGSGAYNSYGATTISGEKNGWTGVGFTNSANAYQVTQMTNRGQVGYYDEATGRWLEYVDTLGNKTLDQTGDYNSGRLNPGWAVETWGCSTGQLAKAAYTVADGWAWNGKLLSCESGVWRRAGGPPTMTVINAGYSVCGGPAVYAVGNHRACFLSGITTGRDGDNWRNNTAQLYMSGATWLIRIGESSGYGECTTAWVSCF